jgi:hypothetical protein
MNLKKASFYIFFLILGVFGSYASFMLWVTRNIELTTVDKLGVFGDSFGVTTSLFSGLAFAGLILTILLQREELRESRDIFRKQKFEDGFFRLLDFYQRNLNSIKIKEPSSADVHEGIGAFGFLLKRLTVVMEPFEKYLEDSSTFEVYEYYFFVEIQKVLTKQSRYLGTLESILTIIDQDLDTDVEKETYWKILSSQLTSFELKYIVFQCLVAPKDNKLRELMHQSNIIQLRAGDIRFSRVLMRIYEKTHNYEIKRIKSTPTLPYTRKEVRNIKRNHLKLNRETNKLSH